MMFGNSIFIFLMILSFENYRIQKSIPTMQSMSDIATNTDKEEEK